MLPAYIRIHDKIKADVDDGTWKIGQRLPSERDLCNTFDVSRMTVRQAITLLVDEGILERKPGSGTFVASSRVKEKMRGTTSFTEIVKSQGKKPSSELISYKRVHPNEFEIKIYDKKEVPDLVRKIVEAGEDIYSVNLIEPSLEDIYFALTAGRKED